jgi:formyltetrahydrofolate deformylase
MTLPAERTPGLRPDVGRLTISCHDRPGIVAAVAGFFAEQGANLIHADQHSSDPEGGRFFMRLEFHLDALESRRQELAALFDEKVAGSFRMRWQISLESEPKTVALLVSKSDHCLLDLLWRRRRNELPMNLAMIVSNHDSLRSDAEAFGVDFHHVPMDNHDAGERQMLDLITSRGIELGVLARYMRVLSSRFLERAGCPFINIHHSFLPAFAGADPYAQAHQRGVKLVGATAHYVTAELDAGPILAQDVVAVGHRETVADLRRLGADVERAVLAQAVKWHLEDRVLLDGHRTVVFR